MANLVATTYETILPILKADGSKKLGNNTWAFAEDGVIVVALHGNRIARLHPDGIVEINMCGWPTVTTRDRLCQLIPGGNVTTRSGVQSLSTYGTYNEQTGRYDFRSREIPTYGWVTAWHPDVGVNV